MQKIIIAVIALFTILIILVKADIIKISKQDLASDRQIYLGAWVGGFWDNDSKQLHPQKLTEFENSIGKKVAIASFYRGWAELEEKSLIQDLETISANGWVPMISANPYFFDECLHKTDSLYKAIANGSCDSVLRGISKNLASYEGKLFFRFAWEANIVDVDWGVQKVGSTAQNYVEAWRHFHDIMQEEEVSDVIWVLAFNTNKHDSIPYEKLYPGDEYVDWIGIDGYNWGETQNWSGWQSFSSVFHRSYTELTALAPSKPLMISEFNSASVGGDKASWFEDALNVQIPNNYPKIDAIVFFNEDKLKQEGVDWKIENSTALEIVKNSLQDYIYRSSF